MISLYHRESAEAIIRGRFTDQGGLFSYIALDKRVRASHPLQKVRELVRDVLNDLNRSRGRLYASEGRPSIPPEQLLSDLLLQVFYGIRSERQIRKTKHRGIGRVAADFLLNLIAYNLIRIPKLLAA